MAVPLLRRAPSFSDALRTTPAATCSLKPLAILPTTSFAFWIAASAADWERPTTAGMEYRSGPWDKAALIREPFSILVPGPGSVEITWPRATVSLYASEKSILKPEFLATRWASVLLSEARSGAVVNRPSVRYQPASAADADSMSTSRRASQPLRRFRARRSRSAAKRSGDGSCSGLATVGGGASMMVCAPPESRGSTRPGGIGAGTLWVTS